MSPPPPLDGLLVVDKPPGMTSHDVVDRVRRAALQRRVGHGGTLDPLATGVLPIVLGAATRLVRFLPGDPKVYRVGCRLGFETTTGDADGQPLGPARPVPELDRRRLLLELDRLTGPQLQVPPMFSARKVGGRPLHRAARAGKEVPRAPSPVVVHGLSLIGHGADRIELEVRCSPGTYVRSLVVDLGRQLGCGASVATLVRLQSGPFRLDQAVALEALADRSAVERHRIASEDIPLDLPDCTLASGDERAFVHGRAVPAGHPLPAAPGDVAVRSSTGRLLGIGQVVFGEAGPRLQPRVVSTPESQCPSTT